MINCILRSDRAEPTSPEHLPGSADQQFLVRVSTTPLPVFNSTIFSELKKINITTVEIHDDKEEVTVVSFLVNLRKDIRINERSSCGEKKYIKVQSKFEVMVLGSNCFVAVVVVVLFYVLFCFLML